MRLHKSESKLFIEAIEKQGFNKDSFQFSKKRGWLNISQLNSNNIFKFHRKQETILDENLQWKKSVNYFIIIDAVKSEINDLEAVKLAFLKWLSSL